MLNVFRNVRNELRNRKTRRARKDWHFACPAWIGPLGGTEQCGRPASKENLARALVLPEDVFLVCEVCRKASPVSRWRSEHGSSAKDLAGS